MKKIINLPYGSYVSDVEPFSTTGIPTNSIIHKVLTGCGITTLEIESKRNSIIILPNVPVIKDKVRVHNHLHKERKILGVHKGIDVDDVRAYLLSNVEYKKILTTPESFGKIVKAFKSKSDLLSNYFLLFDECERIITDISYRGTIAAPLNTFFEFENKALVSATTLPFSDERFEQFDHYIIQPDFDYSKSLTLVSTNNVPYSVKTLIENLNSDRVCIFMNTTDGIHATIKTLGIESQSKVFCALESVVKLMVDGYKHATDEFSTKEMAKYNFFTSRYFSALDIKLDYKPDVVIVSDIFFAKHSIIDPKTETIQIVGRFRNGVASLTHVTNYNPRLSVKTEQEAKAYLDGCLDTYDLIQKWYNKEVNEGVKNTLSFLINDSPIANFYTEGKRNSFMIDNALNEERVNSYYVALENLSEAYEQVSSYFTVTHLKEDYPVGDGDMRELKYLQSKAEKNRHIATLMERLTFRMMGYDIPGPWLDQKRILEKKYPLIAQSVGLVGVEGMEQYGFTLEQIRKCIADAQLKNQIKELAQYIQPLFDDHGFTSEASIIEKLGKVYEEHKINGRLYAIHILRYFEGKRTSYNKVNGYWLEGRKQF